METPAACNPSPGRNRPGGDGRPSNSSILAASDCGAVAGPNRPTTVPRRSTKNLVKFHRIPPEPKTPRIPGFDFFRNR